MSGRERWQRKKFLIEELNNCYDDEAQRQGQSEDERASKKQQERNNATAKKDISDRRVKESFRSWSSAARAEWRGES